MARGFRQVGGAELQVGGRRGFLGRQAPHNLGWVGTRQDGVERMGGARRMDSLVVSQVPLLPWSVDIILKNWKQAS